MSQQVTRLIDGSTGLMECKVCGARHWANLKRGGGYVRGSWQCVNGCKPSEDSPKVRREADAIVKTIRATVGSVEFENAMFLQGLL